MYKLAVNKPFSSHHFLIGGDWGPENIKHSHKYQLEVQLSGTDLDKNGYLIDIVQAQEQLEKLVERFNGCTLNDLPEFDGLNPSIENLAAIAYRSLHKYLWNSKLSNIQVKVWEDDKAWVTYQQE